MAQLEEASAEASDASKEETEGVSWTSRMVLIVLASTALAPLGVPFISPALPVIRDVFSVTDATASLLVSAYFLVGILFSPFIGILEDRFGRRPVLGFSLITFGVTGGLLMLVPSFWMILAIRFIQGTAAAGLFISTVTLIGDTFDGAQRNSVLGMNNAILSITAAAFPILGGILVTISWNTPFLVYLVAVPIGLAALKYVEEPVNNVTENDKPGIRKTMGVLANREMIVPYGSAILGEILLFGAILTTLPFYLSREYALEPVTIGIAVSLTSIASAIAAMGNGKLAEGLSNIRIIGFSFVLYGLGLAAFWLAPSLEWVIISAAVFGAGVGFTLPAIDSQITNCIPEGFRGEALSIRNSATFLGRTTGPILFTAIALVIGYPLLLIGSGLVALAIAAVLFVIPLLSK
ncbi:MFS transporter [Candidatus Thorarchaeota archaeon]|nr:MAG: MFS transporter [Candidatus Thorarchaeota archaeon]